MCACAILCKSLEPAIIIILKLKVVIGEGHHLTFQNRPPCKRSLVWTPIQGDRERAMTLRSEILLLHPKKAVLEVDRTILVLVLKPGG